MGDASLTEPVCPGVDEPGRSPSAGSSTEPAQGAHCAVEQPALDGSSFAREPVGPEQQRTH